MENDGYPADFKGYKGVTLYSQWMACKGMSKQDAANKFVEACKSLEEREMLTGEGEEE